MIISALERQAGFYSALFFTINHYIYCKKNNRSFKLDTTNWLFKYNNGWTDYFIDADVIRENNEEPKTYTHNEVLGDHSMYDYRDAIKELYRYTPELSSLIKQTKESLGLVDGDYDSVFIRHGDKLANEAVYIPTWDYVNALLKKNPKCHTLFVQTDNYAVFEEVQDIIRERNLDIRVLTICDPTSRGVIVYEKHIEHLDNALTDNVHNKEYIATYHSEIVKSVSVDKMNPSQIREHTLKMLIGVDIVLHSNFCLLDKQSNVSRFITIAHDNLTGVFDVRYTYENIMMYWTMCPAWW